MNRYDRWGFVVLLLSLSAVLAGACQRLDPDLTGGRRLQQSEVGVGGSTDPGTGGSDGSDCPSLRTQVFDIVQTNCAICHQGSNNPALYLGPFNFILDLAELTSRNSPSSLPGMPVKYVVNGSPDDSYIYRRIVNNSMPPSNRTQRPTSADIDVLNRWITGCIDDSTSPEGWSGSGSTPDGGVDAGPRLEVCTAVTVCPGNGCCVSGRCRPNGTTCGPRPSDVAGEADLFGVGGTCTNGSCERADGGAACGNVGQPCCDSPSSQDGGPPNLACTATRASCLTSDMTMCSACGGHGQPCCKPTICLADHACVNDRVGVVGTCMMCGNLGQPCCGSGSPAQQRCNDPLHTCVADSVQETRCTNGADGGADR